MRVALISEEYDGDSGFFDGGLCSVRDRLVELFPEARLFTLRRKRPPQGFLASWRLAGAAERVDLEGFDAVVSLTRGFAHGAIAQTHTRHLAYLFEPVGLWRAPELAGHWYRLWLGSTLHRAGGWLANSVSSAEWLEKNLRRTAAVLYPPLALARPEDYPDGAPALTSYFLFISDFGEPAAAAAVLEACRRLDWPLVVMSTREAPRVFRRWRENSIRFYTGGEDLRHKLLTRAACLIQAEPVSFPPALAEARALGKPVLAYRGGELPRLIEEGTDGLFFDDWHPGAVADGIRRMRERLPDFKPETLKARAAQFSHERFREEFLKVLEGVL